jgi:hypothetical protein
MPTDCRLFSFINTKAARSSTNRSRIVPPAPRSHGPSFCFYKTGVLISALVTFIVAYQYVRFSVSDLGSTLVVNQVWNRILYQSSVQGKTIANFLLGRFGELSKKRTQENVEFKALISSDTAAKEIMKFAKSRLNKFHNPKLSKERCPGMTVTYALIQMLEKVAEKTDRAGIINKARANKLIQNAAGVIIDLIYDEAGVDYNLYGPIIFSSGGFGNDFTQQSLLAKSRPDLAHLPTTNDEHCTGDGINMGGLEIDTDSAVIGGNGKAIKDLYCAGDVAGGVHREPRSRQTSFDFRVICLLAVQSATMRIVSCMAPPTGEEPYAISSFFLDCMSIVFMFR